MRNKDVLREYKKYKDMTINNLITLRRNKSEMRLNELRKKYLPERYNPASEDETVERKEKKTSV
ncbi:hypothetical protein U8V72_20305 [Priestia filamentosa]|uniref:hypothetical protein n=1 Tax=Priestia filamentosa TaxID=1402861 RepID=UPI0039780596